jgi:hypothetical protein
MTSEEAQSIVLYAAPGTCAKVAMIALRRSALRSRFASSVS